MLEMNLQQACYIISFVEKEGKNDNTALLCLLPIIIIIIITIIISSSCLNHDSLWHLN